MDADSILTTAIEVAIAIGGFSGVVVAVGPSHGREWPESSRLLLSSLLLMTIAAVGFGFLPLIMGSAAVAEPTLWPVASATHAIYLGGAAGYRIRQTIRLPKEQRSLRLRFLIFTAVFSAFILQILNALYLGMVWPYLTAVVLMVLCSFAVFAALLWEMWAAA